MNEKIYIVIPAYNEVQNIDATIGDVLRHGYDNIIVVDDGSEDATFAKASLLSPTIRHVINRGMGAALATGTRYALNQGADIIVHFDADGQHVAGEIGLLLAPIRNGRADIVLGSRYLKANKLPWTKKYLIHKPALFFQNRFSGVHLTDVHNGFRAMTRKAAQRIEIHQDRMAHASEIVNEIHRFSLRYCEVPVTIAYREYGQGFAAGVRIYRDLILKKFLK